MNIIEHGIQHFEKRCERCNCLFEFNLDETFESYDRLSGIKTIYVSCPECRKQIKVW